MTTRRVVVEVPRGVDTVVVEVRWIADGAQGAARVAPVPVYVMNARPDEWPQHPEWAHAGAVGVHLRVLQPQAAPEAIREHLDMAERYGIKVGLVIGVHNSRDWGAGTVFTQHTRRLPDGEVIPDYWSDAFMREWITVRRRVADVVRDHPALAWVGHDFGLDDEAWPAKPWERVKAAGVDIWEYQMRYVRAAHELARMFAPKPVLAQAYTMYSRQALDVLYRSAPANLGIKLNGWRDAFHPRDEVLWPYWEKVKEWGGMRILEPGMVPAGELEKDRTTAEALLRMAMEKWMPDAVNMQREFVEALGK